MLTDFEHELLYACYQACLNAGIDREVAGLYAQLLFDVVQFGHVRP